MLYLPYFVAYAAILVFVIAVIGRFVMWAKMPMHVRWELYPVAHEAKRAHYGVEGTKRAEFCAQHAREGFVNVLGARCTHQGCSKRPTFGVPGQKVRPPGSWRWYACGAGHRGVGTSSFDLMLARC